MPTVYSPPVSTYVALATTTLGSATNSVTFSSIPATYRDLILVGQPRHGSLQAARVRFDATSTYSYVGMYGSGSGSGSSNTFTGNGILVCDMTSSDGSFVAQIQDYSATDKHKTVLSRYSLTSYVTAAIAGRWANTAAINQVVLFTPDGSNFVAGSTFSLFGIEA